MCLADFANVGKPHISPLYILRPSSELVAKHQRSMVMGKLVTVGLGTSIRS